MAASEEGKLSSVVTFRYRNWRGSIGVRRVIPIDITFANYPHHSGGQQWFLNGYCIDKRARRSFAIEDILSPIRHETPITNTPNKEPQE